MRLIDLPLERDEGEYAYAGQLILHGIPPYKLVYNMKWPGTYAAYAAAMGVFGETISGIRIGLLLVTSATAICLFILTKRMFGHVAGVVAAAVQLLLSITVPAMGLYAHATHFVALAAVAGLMVLTPRTGQDQTPFPRIVAAGALLALAALMKQPGMFFGIFAAVWLLARRKVKETGALAGGASAMMGLTALILALAGVFARAKFWTIDYARQYLSQSTLTEGFEQFGTNFGPIFSYTSPLWWAAAVGLVLLFVKAETRRHALFVIGFTLAGVLATTPGLFFRPHYFIVLFPAIALLNGVAIAAASALIPNRAAIVGVFAIVFLLALGMQWSSLMRAEPPLLDKLLYGDNPFPEAIEIGSYLKEHTAPDDRIAVVGSEPEIYFYAARKSATGYIYTYPLMEKQAFAHRMQQEMISEIEQAKPKYLVYVSVQKSWLRKPESEKTIFAWLERYLSAGYVLDGVADIADAGTHYTWGAEAARYQPKTSSLVLVFRRKF